MRNPCHALTVVSALNIEQFGDTSQAPAGLAILMNKCIACHAVFRFAVEQA
jgi:hypothetical protein